MKQLLLSLLAICFIIVPGAAQSDVGKLIEEGIALYDKGDYAGAIEKYDAALQADPASYMAMYEKSLVYTATKKYDEAEVLLKKVLKESKSAELRRLSYVNYGTILDYKGEGKKSIKLYEEGIKEFPNYYLLHFNKGITESGMSNHADALLSFQNSLRNNPYHASSHNAAGRTVANANRIPGILALFSFLLIEPDSKRSASNLDLMNKLIMKGISQSGNNINISIDPSVLDKKKNKEDDFSSAELILSLTAASNSLPDSLGAKTDADRLSYRVQTIVNVIKDIDAKDKGFFKNFYVPFFAEMKKKDFLTTACYIVLSSSGKEDITKWLEDNPIKQELFYDWFKNYKWGTSD